MRAGCGFPTDTANALASPTDYVDVSFNAQAGTPYTFWIRLKAIGVGSARQGIQVVAHDDGPGIDDVDQALRDGFSTSGGLGLGLPGVRRLVDDFQIQSKQNEGTTVTFTKWKA